MSIELLESWSAPNVEFRLAIAEVFEGMARVTQIRADQQTAPVVLPMVPSEIGEIRFGTSSANAMTINSAEAGLVGMGGNDTLTGGAADDFLVGDYFDVDIFTGNPPFDASVIGNDVIYGGGGTDLLDGGQGNDQLFGGDGDDYFAMYEQNLGVDTIRGGAGWDQIDFYDGAGLGYAFVNVAALDLSAAASVEELLFDVELRGTAADNVFDLSGVKNYNISGFSGAPGISGVFNLLDGNDRFTGGVAAESVVGGLGNDTLNGGGGSDTLNGGAGGDSLSGGKGNDTYFVDARLDVIQELSGQGTDTVKTTFSIFNLWDNVENLSNIGSAGFMGTGNTLKNAISGNNFNDTLNGGLGSDTLTGFGGTDVFLFNTALGSTNVDTITDFKPGFDHIHLENTGTGLFNKIRVGELTEAAFKITTPQSAVDADDRIIYNATTGRLIYDADGSGSGVGITFAFLTPNLTLNADDFLVI